MGDSLDEMITTFQKEDAAPEEDFASLLEGSFKKAFARTPRAMRRGCESEK